MNRLCVSVCVALLSLSALPAHAQDDADVRELRAMDDCLLYAGVFMAMMEDEHDPSEGDRRLYDQLLSVAVDILDTSNALAAKLGEDVQARIVAEQHTILERRMDPHRGKPDAAARLRAEFTPDVRSCVAQGMLLGLSDGYQ